MKSEESAAGLRDRWRRFAELVVAGETGKAAYFAAFPRCRSERAAEVNASRLMRQPAVAAHVGLLRRELAERAMSELVLTARERREFLAKVVRAVPAELDAQSSLCQSYKETKGVREVKLPCKLKALELDAKLAGEAIAPGGDPVLDLLEAVRAREGGRERSVLGGPVFNVQPGSAARSGPEEESEGEAGGEEDDGEEGMDEG